MSSVGAGTSAGAFEYNDVVKSFGNHSGIFQEPFRKRAGAFQEAVEVMQEPFKSRSRTVRADPRDFSEFVNFSTGGNYFMWSPPRLAGLCPQLSFWQ